MGHLTDNMRGALLMTASMAAFTLNDTAMKVLLVDVPLFQAIFLRGILASVMLLALAVALKSFRPRMSRQDAIYVTLRTAAEIAATYFFISALRHMPIANLTAILQALPLTVTLAGAVFFGDVVGWRRLTAILLGFVGVLLILRPGADGFSLYGLYALTAVACVTVRDLSVRRISRSVPSLTVATIAAISITVLAGFGSLTDSWVWVEPAQFGLLAFAGIFILLGYLCSVMVMRSGEISFVAPFRYTGLLWALLLGWAVFGDWPKPLTLLGAAIVVGMGIFTFWREHQMKRALK